MDYVTFGNEKRYRLLSFVIAETSQGLRAYQYVFLSDKQVYRVIAYDAEIDTIENILVISSLTMKGQTVNLSEDQIAEIFQDLPEWKKTKFFSFAGIGGNCYFCQYSIPVLHLN